MGGVARRMTGSAGKTSPGARPVPSLYRALDYFAVRVPLLPVEAYRGLGLWLAGEEQVRRALAVGSVTLFDALTRTSPEDGRRRDVDRSILRYLIRMSTRPTPFGLFAGVALGRWGDRTDLQLASAPFRQRTRPDMGWLMPLVIKLESIPAVRRRLRLVTNPAAYIRAGRVFLAERVSRGEAGVPPAVSIRASAVVRRALLTAREPVSYASLASTLLAGTPGASPARVEKLLTELWAQTLLLTDLRPPLTGPSPARYVVERLADIRAAASLRAGLESILRAIAAWDENPEEGGANRYRALVTQAAGIGDVKGSPFQVDATVELTGRTISRLVADEAARAAELLLRMSPLPRGPSQIAAYRRSFEQRYGLYQEVPLLELLDPDFGLGPPPGYTGPSRSVPGMSQATSPRRNQALSDLATTALRERTLCVELDEQTLKQLETSPGSVRPVESLDLFVSVAAASREALDAGQFQVVLGPNVGGMSAGRTLGRFADLVEGARGALEGAARIEERHAPEKLWVDLAYQPRQFRQGNVAIRPNVRRHQITLGVMSGGDSVRTVPLDELVVGIRDGTFYVRWPAVDRDLVITGGHMLNYLRAPAVCRFLADVSRDGYCQLAGFSWGPMASLPFLPRVRVGRIVLALARWRLTRASAGELVAANPPAFPGALERWRTLWQVPRHVYLSAGDHRLLLDLADPPQADELRRDLRGVRGAGGAVVLSEVCPDLEQAWVSDADRRHFVTELVVSLVLRRADTTVSPGAGGRSDDRRPPATPGDRMVVPPTTRVRPPGSEWLFVKLYCGQSLQDDLIAGPIRDLAADALSSGLAEEWFFLRYSDPRRHVRLRFRGRPARLLKELLPVVSTWASELIDHEWCQRFVVDTYEREIERFGGDAGMTAAEALFAADSRAVVDLLDLLQARSVALDRTTLAVLTVDALLDGLGLEPQARSRWSRGPLRARHESTRDYRNRNTRLRALLADGDRVRRERGGEAVADILARLRASVGGLGERFAGLEASGELRRPAGDLYRTFVHLHLNRLLDADGEREQQVLGLLGRVREGLAKFPAP